ncbi:hypothetical protein HGM15179_020159, partial [Zosterops borbonicus]
MLRDPRARPTLERAYGNARSVSRMLGGTREQAPTPPAPPPAPLRVRTLPHLLGVLSRFLRGKVRLYLADTCPRGHLEPDCYVIVGARRDSLGPGAAASGVGTALLLELARFFAAIGREGFQLRRTLLFVSWDGAEFGHLGATEWLEGYPDLLHTKVAAYISLDRAVLGSERFVVRSSPTLGNLVEKVLEQ